MLWINISENILSRRKQNFLVWRLLLFNNFLTTINRFKRNYIFAKAMKKNIYWDLIEIMYFSWHIRKHIGSVVDASIDNANNEVTEALQNVNTDRSSCLITVFFHHHYYFLSSTYHRCVDQNKCASLLICLLFKPGIGLIAGCRLLAHIIWN